MSNSTGLTLIVGGFPELADALDATGLFESVIRTESTGSLRELIKTRAFPREQAKVVFMFASSLSVDTAETLEYLVGRLSASGWRVIVLATSPLGRSIVDAHPAAGYLEMPFTVNQTLGALAGLGAAGITPVEGGHVPIVHAATAPTASPAGWTPAPAAPARPTQPQQPKAATPAAPSGSAWTRPAPQSQTASQTEVQRPAQTRPAPAPKVSPQATPQGAPSPWSSTSTTTPATPQRPVPAQAAAPVAPAPSTPQQRPLARPADQSQIGTAPLARPVGNTPIERRVGTYQDFAPNGSRANRLGRVITITSPKGGTGKSSLSVNLAVYLGLALRGAGRRVALIDANFQQADTGKLLNCYTPNISDVLKDESSLSPGTIEQYMIQRFNVSFLLGPATPRDATPSFFNSRLYGQVLSVLKQNFDYIIIDTPVAELYHDILRGFALPVADYIIVPITPAIHTLMNADSWLRTITLPRHQGGDEINPEKIGVVLNQAQEGVECDEDEVRRELYSWNFIGAIPMTKEWLKATNTGEFVAMMPVPEIHEAFANILYYATGEESLLQGFDAETPTSKKGLLSWVRRRK